MSKSLTAEEKGDLLRLIHKRIADFISLYPDSTMTLDGPLPQKSQECIALLGAVFLVSDNAIEESEGIVRKISNLCYRHQYQGKWKQVQEILEQVYNFSEYRVLVTSEIMSLNDYYGNLESKIYNYIRLLKPKAVGIQRGKVRRPIRRRGYNDKGNQRPNWKKREVSLLIDDREDRRPLVKHPLVGEIRDDTNYALEWKEKTRRDALIGKLLREKEKGGEGYGLCSRPS